MKNQQEIMEALLRGDKIGCMKFKYTEYIHLVDGELVDENGVEQYIIHFPETYSIYVPPKPTPEEVLVALGQGRWVATEENQYSHKEGVLVWKLPPKNNIFTSTENITWVIRHAIKIIDPEEGQ